MLLSIITVAWRNHDGVVKTWQSLAHLAQTKDIKFEWIVVDGNSQDGTAEFLAVCMDSTTCALSARKTTAFTTR